MAPAPEPMAEPEPPDEDRVLIERVLGGDVSAYAEVVHRHETRLRRTVRGIVADHHLVEDVLQEVFLIAYRRLGDFRGEGPFAGWLFRIAVREARRARSRWRRLWRKVAPLEEAQLEAARAHQSALDEPPGELRQALAKLDQLPTRMRTAFVLHVVEDLTYQEIAGILGCAPGTVGSWIHRARARLRGVAPVLENRTTHDSGSHAAPSRSAPDVERVETDGRPS